MGVQRRGWDAGGAVWLFDRSSEFERARLYADLSPQLNMSWWAAGVALELMVLAVGFFIASSSLSRRAE